MFDIGFQELLLIGVVALLVVGPERLPRLARTAGLWIGKARRMVAQVKDEVERELHADELKQMLENPEPLDDLSGAVNGLKEEFDGVLDDLSDDAIEPRSEGESGAAKTGESGAAETGESGAAETGESGAAETGESGAAETGESGAAETVVAAGSRSATDGEPGV